MESQWNSFIEENKDVIPFKPLNVILEAFYWYLEWGRTDDVIYTQNCKDNISRLMYQQ